MKSDCSGAEKQIAVSERRDHQNKLDALRQRKPCQCHECEKTKHMGDVAWCECNCHTKGSPQLKCDKCYKPTPTTSWREDKEKLTKEIKKLRCKARGFDAASQQWGFGQCKKEVLKLLASLQTKEEGK